MTDFSLSLAPADPIDPINHRANVARIYASLPPPLQSQLFTLIEPLPRLIHSLASAGQLAAPPSLEIALTQENAA